MNPTLAVLPLLLWRKCASSSTTMLLIFSSFYWLFSRTTGYYFLAAIRFIWFCALKKRSGARNLGALLIFGHWSNFNENTEKNIH